MSALRVTYVIVERGGGRWEGYTSESEAVDQAKKWDADYPDLAPHRVLKRTITEEQVHP